MENIIFLCRLYIKIIDTRPNVNDNDKFKKDLSEIKELIEKFLNK